MRGNFFQGAVEALDLAVGPERVTSEAAAKQPMALVEALGFDAVAAFCPSRGGNPARPRTRPTYLRRQLASLSTVRTVA